VSAVQISAARYDDDVRGIQRITVDPAIMGGEPCIRGIRVTVGMIVEAIAAGRGIQCLLGDFPCLQEQDVREALAYAGTGDYFRERAERGDVGRAKRILKRAGRDNPPGPGDELV
jgi:uncharacterized protein (DUF433 family)